MADDLLGIENNVSPVPTGLARAAAVISPPHFSQLFKKLAKWAALTDVNGSLITFSAHDFPPCVRHGDR